MNPARPSLALTLCIRDEAQFLEANLAYHRALGVSTVYVYLDRCTDASRAIAASFPWVTVLERDRAPSDRYMSMHQVKCMNDALRRARRDGMDWLMHVDADEFACGDTRPEAVRLLDHVVPRQVSLSAVQRGHLPSMLAPLPASVEQVVLKPKDVVPMVLPEGIPFWKLHYFQIGGSIARPLLDPTTGKVRRLEKRIGNYHGKSIVRTAAAVQAASAHRWRRAGVPPDQSDHTREQPDIPTEMHGCLYHFTVVSGEHWWTKHRKFAEYPDHWEKGTPVRFPKQAWKEASREMSLAEAQRYFERWIAIPRRRLVLPLLRGHVTYETCVDEVLQQVSQSRLELSAETDAIEKSSQ